MTKLRTYACIFALLLSSVVMAQTPNDSTKKETVRGIMVQRDKPFSFKEQPVFAGCAVGFDVAGAAMMGLAKWGQLEGQVRVNIKHRIFPVAEIGWGRSNYTDDKTDQHYKTDAPYFRIGCDYNFIKNPLTGNRIFGGVRYGYTSFKYDMSGHDIVDPVWNVTMPYNVQGYRSSQHWLEIVAGVEARIWKFFHLGWSVRYKIRLKEGDNAYGSAFYVPGFGKNDTSCFGGSLNLIFDI